MERPRACWPRSVRRCRAAPLAARPAMRRRRLRRRLRRRRACRSAGYGRCQPVSGAQDQHRRRPSPLSHGIGVKSWREDVNGAGRRTVWCDVVTGTLSHLTGCCGVCRSTCAACRHWVFTSVAAWPCRLCLLAPPGDLTHQCVLYQFFIANRCGGAAQSARACCPFARLEAQAGRA